MFVLSFNVVVNFVRAFHQKKQSAGDQNYGAAGDFETANGKERTSERVTQVIESSSRMRMSMAQTEANSACLLLLMCGEFPRQYRDENDVVDSQDEFENCQR